MPPSLAETISTQRRDSKFNSSKWVQLSTIGLDKTPRVRTVVFRGWSESYEIEIYTDKRSQKYHELVMNNNFKYAGFFHDLNVNSGLDEL